jgi:predicted dehydrogenase
LTVTIPKRVLIVGAGSIGQRHIRCFLATERAHVEFVEPRDELRRSVAEQYPNSVGHPSLAAALDSSVDAAVIATPASMHISQSLELAGRGIHLLIEKPLSIAMNSVSELQREVAQKRIVAAVAYVYRAHPVLTDMRRAILDGRFGDPVELVAVCGQNFPFYRPAYRETYYTRRETGGGAVQDALTHVMNSGQWLVGDFDRVVSDVAHTVVPGVEVEDTAHVLARHGNVLASYSLNQHQAPNEVTLTVVCQRGTARFENHLCRWRSMTAPGGEWTDRTTPPLERDELFTRQANAFLDAVEGRAAPLCSLDEGISTLRANLAVLKSADNGTWIKTQEIQ